MSALVLPFDLLEAQGTSKVPYSDLVYMYNFTVQILIIFPSIYLFNNIINQALFIFENDYIYTKNISFMDFLYKFRHSSSYRLCDIFEIHLISILSDSLLSNSL